MKNIHHISSTIGHKIFSRWRGGEISNLLMGEGGARVRGGPVASADLDFETNSCLGHSGVSGSSRIDVIFKVWVCADLAVPRPVD